MLYSFSFFAGVATLLALPELPSGRLAIALGLLAFVAGVCWRRWRYAAAVCGACCGFLFAGCHARDSLSQRWPERLEDERVIARVVVDSIPAPVESGWVFDGVVRIERPQRAPAGASVAWGDAFRVRLVSREPEVRPHAGERWRMVLSLRAPTGRANPGAQDFERSLFRDGVQALGSVVGSDLNGRLDEGHRPLTRLRERISERIDAQVTDRDASALIAALAVGDTGRVSREQWRVFNATGTTHLVAISGMHVTLFAVIMFALARRVWSVGAALASVPRETFAAAFGFLAAAGYAALAGLSVPTERTLIMLGVWLFARSIARQSHPFQPFALALLLVLLVDPFAPLSAGFWLSFAAMGAIILSAHGRFTREPLWREALTVQLVVSIALLPFSLALFGSIPLIGIPVNLLAIPAMSWLLVPTVLLALALLPVSSLASNAVLSLAEWLHNMGYPWLAAASDVPSALIHASPPWWWYALAVVALAMAALPWPLLMRVAPLICIAPLAASADRPLEPGSAEVTVLDVGEGSAVVVRTAAHTLVYGTGDSYGTNGRAAESVVVPFLRSSGVYAIDRLVISRASPASGAGAVALSAEMPVQQILVGDPVDAVDPSTVDCASVPSPWQWDGVTFVLGPTGAGHACALTISTAGPGEVRVLGEIDATIVEGGGSARASGAFGEARSARKAGAAETPGTSAADAPRWLVVSSRRAQRSIEKYARFHPEARSAEVLVSADQGAIRVPLDGARGPGTPEAYRAHRRTLWSASP